MEKLVGNTRSLGVDNHLIIRPHLINFRRIKGGTQQYFFLRRFRPGFEVDGALITAEIIDGESLGFAGRPTNVNSKLLHALLDSGVLPVISPVGYDGESGRGGALNVNGDDAASAIAVALQADELLLIADVGGVQDERGEVLPAISLESARELIENGTAAGGMAAKLESAHAALLAGVDRVRICDLAGLVDVGRGTFITQSPSIVT